MRPETIEILRALVKRHGGENLLGLWEDVHNCSREQFVETLDAASKPKSRSRKAPASAPRKPKKKSDLLASFGSEEARIAYTFRTSFNLDGAAGVAKLRQMLLQRGIQESALPRASDDLEGWIRNVISTHPSGLLMDLSLKNK